MPQAAAAETRGVIRPYSPIPERHKPRKVPRRRFTNLNVVEGPGSGGKVQGAAGGDSAAGTALAVRRGGEQPLDQHNYRRLAARRRCAGVTEDGQAQLERLPVGFAEDYFSAPAHSKIGAAVAAAAAAPQAQPAGQPAICDAARALGRPALCGAAAEGPAAAEAAAQPPEEPGALVARSGQGWLRVLQTGFSLLVQGVGSKRPALEAFADEVLLPWGAAVVRMSGFSARFSLADCLRDVIERLYPDAERLGHSVESLVAAIRTVRRMSSVPVRPLCLVVHNLEALPPAHQESLAKLAACPGVHLVASTDSIWAPLSWNPRCLRDFNFCREEVHTQQGFEVEAAGRYPGGLPQWCNPNATRQRAQKASVGLVLRALTPGHRELVQAMAQHQLENGGRAGLSQSRLLTMASDRMIATNVTKLKSLLNELRDHEVVAQRNAADGGTLFHLPVDDRTLQQLAVGQLPEESDGEDSEAEAAEAQP